MSACEGVTSTRSVHPRARVVFTPVWRCAHAPRNPNPYPSLLLQTPIVVIMCGDVPTPVHEGVEGRAGDAGDHVLGTSAGPTPSPTPTPTATPALAPVTHPGVSHSPGTTARLPSGVSLPSATPVAAPSARSGRRAPARAAPASSRPVSPPRRAPAAPMPVATATATAAAASSLLGLGLGLAGQDHSGGGAEGPSGRPRAPRGSHVASAR